MPTLLFSAGPATFTREPRARRLKFVIGVASSVGIRIGNTVIARTCDRLNALAQRKHITHVHNFSQSLKCRPRAVSWLTERFEKCWYCLVNGPSTHVLLEDVESSRRGRSD